MENVETGVAKHVFVYEQDRLSRTDVVASAIRNLFSKHNVKLYDCNGVYDYGNKNDLLFRQVRDAISQFENTQRVQRSKDGKLRRAKEGKWIGGPAPYGYDNDRIRKVLVIDKEQAKTVQEIYQWYSDGLSPAAIQFELLKQGIKTNRGKDRWSIGSISSILKNGFYLGKFDFKGIKIEIPSLMDKALYDRCKKRVKSQRKGHNADSAVKHFYLLRGLLKCGHCGQKLGGMTQTYASGKRRYYYCRWKERRWKLEPEAVDWDRKRGCQMNRSLLVEQTDKFVWDAVVEILRESRSRREEFKLEELSKAQGSKQGKQREVRTLINKLRKLRRKEEQIDQAILDAEVEARIEQKNTKRHSQILKRLQEELQVVGSEILAAGSKLDELQDQRDWVDWYKNFHRQVDKIEKMDDAEKKEFLKTIIRKIDVFLDDDKKTHTVDVHFELPIVGDAIQWRVEQGKRKGYKLFDGNNVASLQIQKKTLLQNWRSV